MSSGFGSVVGDDGVEAEVKTVGEVVVEEEEALGGDVEREGCVEEDALRGCCAGAGGGVGVDIRSCFLRSRQGLSSASESLRRRFEPRSGWADADTDADAVSGSDSGRRVGGAWEFAPSAGDGGSVCR
jgi:hypothetical protein